MLNVEDPEPSPVPDGTGHSRRVRVRYAPSPSGIPHIGNIRTALFNFLFAKNQKGKFILRIEDTDQKRIVPGAIEKIKESLLSLNLKFDEVYRQSERTMIYSKYLNLLKDKGLVYQDEGAWRFKVKSQTEKIGWNDFVHGPVAFSPGVIEDFIIIKSDGFPTYHFASVIDDHDMRITHVMRGDEWISSTPKHLLLYKAFGWEPPTFVHTPPILGPNKKKLSKREGARSVLEYIKDGYLPEAIINFLALLGWSPPPPKHLRGFGRELSRNGGPLRRDASRMDSSEVKVKEEELFSLDQLIKLFSLDRLNKNSPIFNIEKLNWFNKKYLQKYSPEILSEKTRNFSKRARTINDRQLRAIVTLVKDRLTTLADFDKIAAIFFEKGKEKPPPEEKIANAKEAIKSISTWNDRSIEKTLELWILKNKLDPADFKNTLRLAVFAQHSPPIYQSIALLTKKEVLKRIDDAVKKSK
ncbi:hypothetical protein A3C33_01160 [Candidatus Curtissbacteria bacterium RIFCSPHIGHO2_02_FULL_42_58]|nr:MAG: hypothetical protein A3C33_01160 [Candidatus Curtissbacteria bacterium RIFCSPHIGHO2_02_FULL_42_58]OGD96947.1 MAG: hypothetical protein A3E71_00850 [Candidatus Curtissbacteria bacterium RIFCSPHIGHO2_12_FULL_42_33]OGE02219.1 MAG: hypothetical protein A3G16_01025 [Candidatus Curtissbacteria bacterium RIFCSPLOWO2_12_FULL_41_16]